MHIHNFMFLSRLLGVLRSHSFGNVIAAARQPTQWSEPGAVTQREAFQDGRSSERRNSRGPVGAHAECDVHEFTIRSGSYRGPMLVESETKLHLPGDFELGAP